jgi:HSP20 family molecular chaperone IbpA
VDAPTIGAKMEDGVLRIRFQGREDTRPGKSTKPTKRGD